MELNLIQNNTEIKSKLLDYVAEVSTNVPAFVGYTEKALLDNQSLIFKPWRINSLEEFHSIFGGAPHNEFKLSEVGNENESMIQSIPTDKLSHVILNSNNDSSTNVGKSSCYEITQLSSFSFYYSLLFFYANGGGSCYIVSIGDYTSKVQKEDFLNGIDSLLNEKEPTMLVVPEAINFADKRSCYDIQNAMLNHCGIQMQNRIAILDIYTANNRTSSNEKIIDRMDDIYCFRENMDVNCLSYGVAYYPNLNTSVVSESDVTLACFGKISDDTFEMNADSVIALKLLLTEKLLMPITTILSSKCSDAEKVKLGEKRAECIDLIESISSYALNKVKRNIIHEKLVYICPEYRELMKEVTRKINCLPPSSALAGIYTQIDNSRGVWKAPANVDIEKVLGTTVTITNDEHNLFMMPLNGKAVNVISEFSSEGFKVYGARTLDGNSMEYRYINVRRTIIMLEQSIKNAVETFIFQPNEPKTWDSVKSLIGSFLAKIWRNGGLVGYSLEDAYQIYLGLGETMTAEDIMEGIMRIKVLVAINRPAEFLEITIEQKMR